uniref:SAM-dependent MTase RsmB/NOP-type domain-containing protein n=1 Tax=Pelagomonas calceolata TaxID=35677 RepID=A0A7S3ZRR6_9STRA|mmetsp:Transcript_26112/g.73248  ORF Transcript_26112/g.73248 Transcript_26112/m.73248 type:complete len:405 (-) Transcript_26112:17-1231(-)
MLAFLLLSCAQALNPAALAREALVEYRANERIAPDKVLAKVLRTNPCTDGERRAAADAFLGTAARLRRYEWLCKDVHGDAEEIAASLLQARDEDRTTTEWPSDPNERLSVESGAPLWLCARWRRDLGDDEARAVAFASTSRGPVTLRVRDEVAIDAVEASLGVRTARPPRNIGAPRALTLTEGRPPGGVWALPGWEEALFEVQDAGSQAIVEACGDGFGTALDMCAGNGGKSIPLAARCRELWCHDVDTERLKRLRARARRAGVSVQCTDGTLPDATFDLVLVDAPCSGSGVLRRLGRTMSFDVADGDEEDLAARRRSRDRVVHARADDALADFARLQLSLLRNAAARCGDRLVYATCSTLREENEDVVAAFDDESFELLDTRRLLPGPWHDGFFVARWRRRSV